MAVFALLISEQGCVSWLSEFFFNILTEDVGGYCAMSPTNKNVRVFPEIVS